MDAISNSRLNLSENLSQCLVTCTVWPMEAESSIDQIDAEHRQLSDKPT